MTGFESTIQPREDMLAVGGKVGELVSTMESREGMLVVDGRLGKQLICLTRQSGAFEENHASWLARRVLGADHEGLFSGVNLWALFSSPQSFLVPFVFLVAFQEAKTPRIPCVIPELPIFHLIFTSFSLLLPLCVRKEMPPPSTYTHAKSKVKRGERGSVVDGVWRPSLTQQ